MMRIPPPIVMLAFGALAYGIGFIYYIEWLGQFNYALSALFSLLALACIAPSVVAFSRAQTTINPYTPKSTSTLVKSGIFRLTRNPMYLAMVLALAAWCAYLDNALALLTIIGFIAYMNVFQIRYEEAALLEIFGKEYTDYCSTVRRWL